MDSRNFLFLFYGFSAAWLIVLLYVISLARRSARLKRELDAVKGLVGGGAAEETRDTRTSLR